jgi:hypothetical protein
MHRLLFALATLLSICAPNAGVAQGSDVQFPVVFTSNAELSKFGLAIASVWVGSDKERGLLHRCYYYGDGGDVITVSHERLLRYAERGFTLNSLCLGLMSETLFDPETGRRLPTYILVNAAKAAGGTPPDVESTFEHPLELPSCFRRALPYMDCVFNFDRLTGEPLSDAKKLGFRELGRSLNEALERAVAERLVCRWPFCSERRFDVSYVIGSLAAGDDEPQICSNRGYLPHFIESELAPRGISVAKSLMEGAHLSCFDISLNLPTGFGYTMDADGSAGPDVSAAVLKAAVDPKRRLGQIDPAALAAKLQPYDASAVQTAPRPGR